MAANLRLFALYGPVLLYVSAAIHFAQLLLLPTTRETYLLIAVSKMVLLSAASMFHLGKLHGIRMWQAFAAVLSVELFLAAPLLLQLARLPR
jgi:hypothetical protein